MANKIEITAKTVEEFDELRELYESLHTRVKGNIASVARHVSTPVFKIRQSFEGVPKINVPNDIHAVEFSESGVRVRCKNATYEYHYKTDNGVVVDAW